MIGLLYQHIVLKFIACFNFSEKFKDEKIPKFEDAVSLALSLNMTIYLDVKECKPEVRCLILSSTLFFLLTYLLTPRLKAY